MTEHKFTDDEIIRALEEELKTALVINHRFEESNDTENPEDHKFIALLSDTIKLINRQKAEIERLENENKILSENADTAFQDGLNEAQDLYAEQIRREIRAEAIKEFAERLKTEMSFGRYIQVDQIDNLVKEMTEGGKDGRN